MFSELNRVGHIDEIVIAIATDEEVYLLQHITFEIQQF
jgi:hypothetical protein